MSKSPIEIAQDTLSTLEKIIGVHPINDRMSYYLIAIATVIQSERDVNAKLERKVEMLKKAIQIFLDESTGCTVEYRIAIATSGLNKALKELEGV